MHRITPINAPRALFATVLPFSPSLLLSFSPSLLPSFSESAAASAATPPPNIVGIIADDMSPDTAAYGLRDVKTPRPETRRLDRKIPT
ncbi:MAG: hypothetical protein NTX09_04370 [Verrucomicrobia bacterium]|nr:hypothetical protein [Verrucomicrobiota bacterium]